MTDKFDPYAELGISRDATPDEINAAWKRAAKETHPDKGGDPKAFHRASRALTILRDPAKRRRYDQTGDTEQTIDDTTAQALTVIANLMEQMLLEGNAPTHLDLVEVWCDCIREARTQTEREVSKLAAAERQAERLVKRFHGRLPDRNLVQAMMQDIGGKFTAQRGKLLLNIAAYDKAIELLKDYRFEADKPVHASEQMVRIMGSGFFSTSTAGGY